MKHLLIALALTAIILIGCSSGELQAAKAQAQNASAKVDEVKASLEQAQERANAALQDLQEKNEELQTCLQAAGKRDNETQALIKSLGNDVSKARSDLAACQKKVAGAEESAAVISDAARRICCAKRIDEPSIDSYAVEDGRIVCKSGAEKTVSC